MSGPGAGLCLAGLVLAGGEGRRMGGADKALLPFAGVRLIDHVAARFAPQVEHFAVSRHDAPLAGFPTLLDPEGARSGPLAGVLAGLRWARGQGASHLLTVSVDTPFLPPDLAPRLLAGSETGAAVAASHGRVHYACALWPLELEGPVAEALASGERRLRAALALGGPVAEVAFEGNPDPFFNLNAPADLARAEALLR